MKRVVRRRRTVDRTAAPTDFDDSTLQLESNHRRPSARVLVLAVVGIVVSIPIFVRMSSEGVNSDILLHASIAQQDMADGRWFTYTAYSPMIYGLSVGGHLMSLRAASIAILACAVGAKVVVADAAARRWGSSERAGLMIASATIVCTPLVALGQSVRNAAPYDGPLNGAIYLGQFSATVWHNSTSIASLPLVLLAAMFARRAIEKPTPSSSASAGIAFAVCSLMKPNYALAALPVFVLAAAWEARRDVGARVRRVAVVCLLMAGPTGAILLLEFVLLRSNPHIIQSSFTFEPMVVWRYYSSSPPRSLLLSVAFPLVATAVVVRAHRRIGKWLLLTWAVFAVAVLQLALLGERNRVTGEPIFDGNWFWGPHAAVLVLFVAAAASLSQVTRSTDHSTADTPCPAVVGRTGPLLAWCVLGAHAASGMVYVWRLFEVSDGFVT